MQTLSDPKGHLYILPEKGGENYTIKSQRNHELPYTKTTAERTSVIWATKPKMCIVLSNKGQI